MSCYRKLENAVSFEVTERTEAFVCARFARFTEGLPIKKKKKTFFLQKVTCFYYVLVRYLLIVDDEAIGMSRYVIELSLRAYTTYGD